MGAESGRRSKVSDLYYYLLFRAAVVDGYCEARGEARRNGFSREQLRLHNGLQQQAPEVDAAAKQ